MKSEKIKNYASTVIYFLYRCIRFIFRLTLVASKATIKFVKPVYQRFKIFWIVIFLSLANLIGLYFIFIPTQSKIRGCLTTTMFEVELCPESKDYVPLKKISRSMQNAIIATEDGDFYKHEGFDTDGIKHCFEKLKKERRIVCGGSTISQQLAKNMFLSRNKTFIRKGLEALITVKIEDTLTKQEILERYLNVVQFGKGIFGIKAAAKFYFKKSPAELTVLESAFLAMVLPNPEKYSRSYFNKDLSRFATKRLRRIIRDLNKMGAISSAQYESSLADLDTFLRPPKPPEDLNLDNLEMTKDEFEEFEKELSLDDEE